MGIYRHSVLHSTLRGWIRHRDSIVDDSTVCLSSQLLARAGTRADGVPVSVASGLLHCSLTESEFRATQTKAILFRGERQDAGMLQNNAKGEIAILIVSVLCVCLSPVESHGTTSSFCCDGQQTEVDLCETQLMTLFSPPVTQTLIPFSPFHYHHSI